MEKQYGNTSKSVKPKVNSESKPIAGKMYIALEDGRLVPVNTNLSIVRPPGEKVVIRSPPLNLASSVAKFQLKSHFKKAKPKASVSTSKKQKVVKTKQTISPPLTKKREAKKMLFPSPEKKARVSNISSSTKVNLKTSPVSDYIEIIDLDKESDSNRGNLSDTSVADSIENECTTPEYLYDELLDDEEIPQHASSQSKESEAVECGSLNNIPQESNLDSEMHSEDSEEEEIIDEDSAEAFSDSGAALDVTERVKSGSAMKSKNKAQNVVHSQYLSHILKSTRLKKINRPRKLVKATLPKNQRISDKSPDLTVPANINQFGDCLKTRLGRFHYGLTLNDPPCQFFQGVLKGASGQTLAAMFGDLNLISRFEGVPLKELGHFAIDSTFRVIPNSTVGINQVLSIKLLFHDQVIPLWYAITSCSSPELYKRILIEFQQHVLDWPFNSALLNNDPALCQAVLALFPDIELYGSWFHYCNSIWKELTLNNLTERCKTDSTLMTAVKLLMVMPYLPPLSETPSSISMLEGFEFVRTYAKGNNLPKEFNNVLGYVAAFWFNKVKTKNFTVFGKQTSSLNFIEIFQLALLSYMKPNGNVWTLTHSFQSVAKTTNLEFQRFLNGKPLLTKRNRGKKFNVPIRQNIKRLLLGNYNVKTFLEKCTIYCDEMLDIFLHPLYPTSTTEKTNYIHTPGWRIKINNT